MFLTILHATESKRCDQKFYSTRCWLDCKWNWQGRSQVVSARQTFSFVSIQRVGGGTAVFLNERSIQFRSKVDPCRIFEDAPATAAGRSLLSAHNVRCSWTCQAQRDFLHSMITPQKQVDLVQELKEIKKLDKSKSDQQSSQLLIDQLFLKTQTTPFIYF